MTRFAQPKGCRRLIVDTDLGLDDLVALAILRLQQCHFSKESGFYDHQNASQFTNYFLSGVMLTSGISTANYENAALLSRILPPETDIYVESTRKSLSWNNIEKPTWWTRTSDNVRSFLSSLPANETAKKNNDIMTAEEYLANHLHDPDIDVLCMAPLTNVAKAIDMFKERNPNSPICSHFYIMGGIQSESRVTRRSESTAPFGYHDIFLEKNTTKDKYIEPLSDQFGEFNFALDIESARKVLAAVSTHIITLEACTLVPRHLRDNECSTSLAAVLTKKLETSNCSEQLNAARDVLLKLLKEFGTDETQWDSIAAAIYCNVFPSDNMHIQARKSILLLSNLGEITYGDSEDAKKVRGIQNDAAPSLHSIYPAFTVGDEMVFYEFLSSILFHKISCK